MQAQRDLKLDAYAELRDYSERDFLGEEQPSLEEYVRSLPSNTRADVGWYLDALLEVIEGQLHQLATNETPDEYEHFIIEDIEKEREKIKSLMRLV